MKLNIIKENGQALLKVEVVGEMWTKAVNKAKNVELENIVVPGFRKGKAPAELMTKYLSNEKVLTRAVNKVSEEAYKFVMTQEEVMRLKMLDTPKLHVDEIKEDGVVLSFNVDLLPEINLGDYKAIKIEQTQVEVNDEDVEKVLQQISKNFGSYETKNEAIKNGDKAVFDFEGTLNGVAFPGGSAQNYSLEIGSGQFIPGFEDQMIGMLPGEEKDINVTFPANYHSKDLAGKEVVFKVKLHEVQAASTTEVNDDLAKKLGLEDVQNLEQLKARIRTDIKSQKELNAKQENEIRIMEQLLESIGDVAIPSTMKQNELKNLKEQFKVRLQQQGVTLEAYCKQTGISEQEIDAELTKDAIARIKTALILDEIAAIENVKVNDKEIQEHYTQLSSQYGMDVDTIQKAIPKADIAYRMKNQKVINLLMNYALS